MSCIKRQTEEDVLYSKKKNEQIARDDLISIFFSNHLTKTKHQNPFDPNHLSPNCQHQVLFSKTSEIILLTLFNHCQHENHTLATRPLRRRPELHAAIPRSLSSRSSCRAPACQPWNAHRYLPAKREGYSASPFAPRAAKGPHKNQKIASVSARLNG
jgi:hypothetical protein